MPTSLAPFDRITLCLPRDSDLKQRILQQAELCGESVNTYIIRAIEARMHGRPLKLDGPDHSGTDRWNDA